MKIRFDRAVIWNGLWTQPQNADGTGGHVVDATAAEIAALNASGSRYETVADGPGRKVQGATIDSRRD